MTWVIWPRVGQAVSIVYSFGRVALSSCELNWRMEWEDSR
ncbi:MAG: hypothetical protein K0Q52_110 [Microbacterium sp.]|jgi:hypothetical protein|nr:hypothetical protein [Microbacterium sp.]